jgi:hypothetical protein
VAAVVAVVAVVAVIAAEVAPRAAGRGKRVLSSRFTAENGRPYQTVARLPLVQPFECPSLGGPTITGTVYVAY